MKASAAVSAKSRPRPSLQAGLFRAFSRSFLVEKAARLQDGEVYATWHGLEPVSTSRNDVSVQEFDARGGFLSIPCTPNCPRFTRFVEPGRLALITFGPCAGKMCTIVDIVDQKRVVVDGPESITGVKRHMMPVKRLSLTDFCASPKSSSRVKKLAISELSRGIKVKRGCREKTLKKARARARKP